VILVETMGIQGYVEMGGLPITFPFRHSTSSSRFIIGDIPSCRDFASFARLTLASLQTRGSAMGLVSFVFSNGKKERCNVLYHRQPNVCTTDEQMTENKTIGDVESS